MDVKQPYQVGKDSLPVLEPVTEPIDHPDFFIRWLSYWNERENKRSRLLLEGYSQFVTEDRPNRQIILADAKAIMERWFENGVEYNERLVDSLFKVSARALGIKVYTNEPPRLRSILENSAAVIRRHILEAKRIPVMNHLDMLIRCPRIVIDGRELKVGYGPYLVMPLPFGTVYETEGFPPTKRAELVANNWWDIQSQRLWRDITLVCNEGNEQWQPKSIAEVEHNYDYERKLQTSGLTRAQQIELDGRYHRGLYFEEVQGALREIAINRTLKDMRKSYEEIHEKWRR